MAPSSLPAPIALRLPVVAAVLFLVGFLLLKLARSERLRKSKLPLPPRPRGNLILGNLFEMLDAVNKKQQHLLLNRYAREYGEIVRVRSGPFTEYFLNSDKAVKEVFDRSSASTSERPRWIASNEQMTGEWNVLLLNGSSPRWKKQRKTIHSGLASIPRADAGLPYLHYETAKFMFQVGRLPPASLAGQQLYTLISRYTYSTFASQTFGMDIPNTENEVIHDIHETGLAQILATLPGFSMVDVFPFLDKLPMILKPWERRNRARFQRDLKFCREKLERIQRLKSQGITHDAFLPRVEGQQLPPEFESIDEAAYLSLMLVIGAADTSAMSTWAFLEAMLLFPEVQEKGRKEIEKVVGERMPVYDDIENIPYIRCLMKETWRWRPPVALGHPHVTTREITYGGYRIPKGASLHLNAYAIGHDEARHKDPECFIPERYENDHTTTMQSINASDVTTRDHFAFGAGRRVCPGYHIAERSLAVAIMRLLWAFKIEAMPGTKSPLDPLTFEGQMMPGTPDKRMPVTLRILDHKKDIVDRYFEDLNASRPELEPLVDTTTGQGRFDRLDHSYLAADH